MKRKLESDAEIDKEVNLGDVDEFRDQILEEELSNSSKSDDIGAKDDFVRVIKLSGPQSELALPDGWVGMYHKSGGIIYLHRKTRVCTWARPYHIGEASVRKHDVPTIAIPCLHQVAFLKNRKKRRMWSIHDGNISHHTGNLGNHCGGHGNHLGNQGNQMKSEECSTNISDVDKGYITSDDPRTDDHYGKKDKNRTEMDSHQGNSDGDYHNPDVNHGNKSENCSHVDNSVGNTDGIHDNSQSGDIHSNTDSNHVITNFSNSVITADNTGIANDVNTRMSTVHNNFIRHKTICSVKALESCHNDCDSGNRSNSESLKPTHQPQMLTIQDVSNYLGKLWQFRDISKEEEQKFFLTDSNEAPRDSTQEYKSTEMLKTIPYLVQGKNPKSRNNEKVVINPAGKSARSLLHEYCLKVMNLKPEYETRESGVTKTPFLATVTIDGLVYGSGMATTKKQSKHVAAQRTLEIFIPDFKKLVNVEEHLKIFDDIAIEDPNVYELTSKLGLLSPYQVLCECIKRNQGVLTSELKFDLQHGADNQLYYTMECGKYKTNGTCRSKKSGRELASQALLQKLHPHLKNWGSVLRIYVDEHTAQEFTKPDAPAPVTSSNLNKDLLCDLKHEMWQLLKKKKKTHTCSKSSISRSFTDIEI